MRWVRPMRRLVPFRSENPPHPHPLRPEGQRGRRQSTPKDQRFMSDTEDQGGRIFFSAPKRSMEHEDEIKLLSVGVDIGSATSHLAFSRLLMERCDNRYVVAKREILHESTILLTPYTQEGLIDTEVLGQFIAAQYEAAG